MRTPDEIRSLLEQDEVPTVQDHDLLAQALNERFSEWGRFDQVRYSRGSS